MSLPTARRMGAAVDPDDFLDRLVRARDAAIEARCPHGLDPKASRRGFVEVRGIFAANTSELLRSEHPTGQVHWDCLTEWVERENALDTEVPF